MQAQNNKNARPYSTIAMLIMIPIVGIFVSAIFLTEKKVIEIGTVSRHFLYGIASTAGLWTGCMMIVKYLWKKYPWEHTPVRHLIIEVSVILAYTLLFSGTLYYLSSYFGFIEWKESNSAKEIFVTVLITFFITTLHESVFFYRQWKYNFSKSAKLQSKHLKAEYESLKSQINPHYIFNSLNNLISIVDDNPLAVDYINQMSSYLRYMIKSKSEELVALEDELSMLEKYIYLHKIRFGDIFTVDIDILDGAKNFKLPPLSLQMLVENCIKHNVIAKNKPLHIQIKIGHKVIIIENNRNPKKVTDSTGQGLNNIIERYKYFTNKEILIEESESNFSVTLPLIA